MAILLVRVEAPAQDKTDETYLDFEHVRTTGSLLQHVQQLAWDLLPGASQIQATYLDDEGDKCTLTEQTAKDALSFAIGWEPATAHAGMDDTRLLNICVHGLWAQELQIPTPMEVDEGETLEEAASDIVAAIVDECTDSVDQACQALSPDQVDLSPAEEGLAGDNMMMKCDPAELQQTHVLPDQVQVNKQTPGFASLSCIPLSSEDEMLTLAEFAEKSRNQKIMGAVGAEECSPKEVDHAANRPNPAEVEKLIQPPHVIRRVFQRGSEKLKQMQMKREPGSQSPKGSFCCTEPDTLQVALGQPAEAESQIQCLRHQVEQTHMELEEMRQQAKEAKLHAREVEEQAEEDVKRHVEESAKYMQEAEEAKVVAREAEHTRDLTAEAEELVRKLVQEQAHEIEGLLQTLSNEKTARKDSEEEIQNAQELAESSEQRLAHEKLSLCEAFSEEQNARKEAELAKELAQYLADGLQQSLADERTSRCTAEEEVGQLQALVNDLQQNLADQQEAARAAVETKLHFQVLVGSLQCNLEAERNARSSMEEALSEEKIARKGSDDETQCLKEALDSLAQEGTWFAESAESARKQAEEAKLQADKEKSHRSECEEAKVRAEELADGLQQDLLEEEAARKEAEEAKLQAEEAKLQAEERSHLAQDVADCLQHSVNDARQCLALEEEAKKQAEAANERMQEVAAGLQRDLEEETNARTIFEKAAQEAQEGWECEIDQAREALLNANKTAHLEIDALKAELLSAKERAARAEQTALDMQQSKAALPRYSASVHMIEDCPLTLGIEAEEDETARGDATKELADLVSSCGADKAFRIGRVRLPATFSEIMPACARVAVKNDGAVRWPQTTVVMNIEGENLGLQVMALGMLEPGEVKEIEMDLEVCAKSDHSQKRVYRPRQAGHTMPQLAPRFVAGESRAETRSLWAIVDAATGVRLGPLLVFEAVWDLP